MQESRMINHEETQTLRILILLKQESDIFNEAQVEVYEIELKEAA